MKNFHNINLPSFIAVHAKSSPTFCTSVAQTASGREVRAMNRAHSIQRYTISNCRLSIFQFDEFNCFFRARRGRQYSFRMHDYADCMIYNQKINVENADHSYEIVKIYKDLLEPYARRITKPVVGSVRLTFENFDLKPENIDFNKGIITFNHIIDNKPFIINAIFDVEVRFASDSFSYSIHKDGSILIEDLELIEVIL